jgi:hypothetical protein
MGTDKRHFSCSIDCNAMYTERAEPLFREFGELYLKKYGEAVYTKIEEECATKKKDDELKLKKRPVNTRQFSKQLYC